MDRRTFAALGSAALAAPLTLFAQPPNRRYRVAILDEVDENTLQEIWAAFRNRLRELGYVEGKNVAFEVRHALGATERLPALAAELVALNPDLIACSGTPPTRAASRATSSIPVVFVSAGDPVATGLVASLARPGRNVTGISSVTTETGQKTLELIRELSPGAQRIAYLTDTANPGASALFSRLEEHARGLKLAIRMLDGAGRKALDQAFETIRRERIQAFLVGASTTLLDYRDEIVRFAAREKLPVVYGRVEYAPVGGLLSYGADRTIAARRGADLVHRILGGAKPADLPVEQISNLKMVLNLKTARALGIAIPGTVRLRADEVIE